jgi:magnesium-transporting ATPase (P-type)
MCVRCVWCGVVWCGCVCVCVWAWICGPSPVFADCWCAKVPGKFNGNPSEVALVNFFEAFQAGTVADLRAQYPVVSCFTAPLCSTCLPLLPSGSFPVDIVIFCSSSVVRSLSFILSQVYSINFNSKNKYSASVIRGSLSGEAAPNTRYTALMKGAPEVIAKVSWPRTSVPSSLCGCIVFLATARV